MRVPAALAAIPLLAGSAAGVAFVDSTPERLVLAAAAAAVFALVAGCGFLVEQCDGAVTCTVICGCAFAGVSLGTSSARTLYAPPLLLWFDSHVAAASDPVQVTGVLREDGAFTDAGALLTLDVQQVGATRARGGVRLSVAGAVPPGAVREWRAGRRVTMPVLLRRPAAFRNPGTTDDTRPLARRGVVLTGVVKSAALVEVTGRGGAVEELAAAARAWSRTVLGRHIAPLSERSSAIALAILIGDRTGLSDEDERRLQEAGTYHVIAISGGNIAILTALLLALARAAQLPYRAAALFTLGAVLLYGEIAGGAASVSRAVTAAAVFLVALALDHRGAALNTVAVAAVLGVGVSPVAVFDAGFLLSFGATVAIIIGVPRLLRVLHRGRVLAAMFAATVCAELALAPISASFFSRVTAAGLVVNFAAIPLMTVVQVGSMAVLAVAPVDVAWADRLAFVVHYAATGLVESSRFVELAPWLSREVHAPAWWLCVLYYAAAIALLVPRIRKAAIALLILCGFALMGGPAAAVRNVVAAPPRETLRVVVLDVGQGDATLVTFPDGTSLLVDAGGLAGTTFDVGRRVVAPALRALQVSRLYAFALTHADPDHIGGADEVLRRFRPANIWEGVPVPPHPALRELAARAAAQRTVWRTVRPGDTERAGGVEIRVLHPPEPEWERQRVRNDDSIVLELRYGDVAVLLPGDIGRDVERTLVPTLRPARTLILKAAHHGSATSSSDAFIEATKPAAVIFSAGKRNMFGHPAPVVVERFTRRGIPTFNTAQDGAVFVETDGRRVRVWGWGSRSVRNFH